MAERANERRRVELALLRLLQDARLPECQAHLSTDFANAHESTIYFFSQSSRQWRVEFLDRKLEHCF